MDWFTGKNHTGKPHIPSEKQGYRFSPKPIHSEYGEKAWEFDGKRVIS